MVVLHILRPRISTNSSPPLRRRYNLRHGVFAEKLDSRGKSQEASGAGDEYVLASSNGGGLSYRTRHPTHVHLCFSNFCLSETLPPILRIHPCVCLKPNRPSHKTTCLSDTCSRRPNLRRLYPRTCPNERSPSACNARMTIALECDHPYVLCFAKKP